MLAVVVEKTVTPAFANSVPSYLYDFSRISDPVAKIGRVVQVVVRSDKFTIERFHHGLSCDQILSVHAVDVYYLAVTNVDRKVTVEPLM